MASLLVVPCAHAQAWKLAYLENYQAVWKRSEPLHAWLDRFFDGREETDATIVLKDGTRLANAVGLLNEDRIEWAAIEVPGPLEAWALLARPDAFMQLPNEPQQLAMHIVMKQGSLAEQINSRRRMLAWQGEVGGVARVLALWPMVVGGYLVTPSPYVIDAQTNEKELREVVRRFRLNKLDPAPAQLLLEFSVKQAAVDSSNPTETPLTESIKSPEVRGMFDRLFEACGHSVPQLHETLRLFLAEVAWREARLAGMTEVTELLGALQDTIKPYERSVGFADLLSGLRVGEVDCDVASLIGVEVLARYGVDALTIHGYIESDEYSQRGSKERQQVRIGHAWIGIPSTHDGITRWYWFDPVDLLGKLGSHPWIKDGELKISRRWVQDVRKGTPEHLAKMELQFLNWSRHEAGEP